jgi:hypothetical protein
MLHGQEKSGLDSDTAIKTNQKLRVIENLSSSQLSDDGASPDDRQRAVVVEAL